MTHIPHQALDTTVDELAIEEARVNLSQALTTLTGHASHITDLTDTRHRGLGFLTPEARRIMDQQIRAERTDRATTARRLRDRQLHWNLYDPAPAASGPTRAPGNIRAWSWAVEADQVLTDLTRRAIRVLYADGVCTLRRLPAEHTLRQLIGHVRTLSWDLTDLRLLDTMIRQVEWLNQEASRIVDGAQRVALNGDCPHCGRRTLVVHLSGDDEGVIRCGRDPHTGDLEPCVCDDAYCACKHSPRTHRHEWHRDKGATRDGWWHLYDLLNRTTDR